MKKRMLRAFGVVVVLVIVSWMFSGCEELCPGGCKGTADCNGPATECDEETRKCVSVLDSTKVECDPCEVCGSDGQCRYQCTEDEYCDVDTGKCLSSGCSPDGILFGVCGKAANDYCQTYICKDGKWVKYQFADCGRDMVCKWYEGFTGESYCQCESP